MTPRAPPPPPPFHTQVPVRSRDKDTLMARLAEKRAVHLSPSRVKTERTRCLPEIERDPRPTWERGTRTDKVHFDI
jgi:hypothetical protein